MDGAAASLLGDLAFDQALFGHLFVGEPEVGDVGGAQAVNILEGAADFFQFEVHAEFLQQFDQDAGTFSQDGLRI